MSPGLLAPGVTIGGAIRKLWNVPAVLYMNITVCVDPGLVGLGGVVIVSVKCSVY